MVQTCLNILRFQDQKNCLLATTSILWCRYFSRTELWDDSHISPENKGLSKEKWQKWLLPLPDEIKISTGVNMLAQSNSASTAKTGADNVAPRESLASHSCQLSWGPGEPQQHPPCPSMSSSKQKPGWKPLYQQAPAPRHTATCDDESQGAFGFYRSSSSTQPGQHRHKPTPDIAWMCSPSAWLSYQV